MLQLFFYCVNCIFLFVVDVTKNISEMAFLFTRVKKIIM